MATTKFIIDQSKREALDKTQAEQLLSPVNEGITWLKLSGKSFGDGSAEVAAQALQRASPTLTHLDISDVIASRPEDEAKRTLSTIADGLTSCKHLTYLDLSDNALGAKGIRAVGHILDKQRNLRHLYLCNNGLAADAGNLITQALVPHVPIPSSSAVTTPSPSSPETEPEPEETQTTNSVNTTTNTTTTNNTNHTDRDNSNDRPCDDVSTSLETLHFHNNLLETAGAIALAPVVENSPHLSDFRFSSLRLGREGAMHICKVLTPRASTTLRKLNLSDNSFAGEAGISLSHCLRDAPFLEALIINDALLGDTGVARLCHTLVEGAPKLEVLDVSANEVAAEGAKGLARLVAVGRLTDVKAEDNELGNVGARRLAVGLKKSVTIRTLDVSACDIKSKGALSIAQGVVNKKTLIKLSMDRNCIAEETVEQLETMLEERLTPFEDNDEDDEDDDEDEEDEDEDDEGDEEGDEADTDKAVKSGDTAENVDINPDDERLDDLIAQVKKIDL